MFRLLHLAPPYYLARFQSPQGTRRFMAPFILPLPSQSPHCSCYSLTPFLSLVLPSPHSFSHFLHTLIPLPVQFPPSPCSSPITPPSPYTSTPHILLHLVSFSIPPKPFFHSLHSLSLSLPFLSHLNAILPSYLFHCPLPPLSPSLSPPTMQRYLLSLPPLLTALT